MANKRIYELDEQSTYSGSLFVECDDSQFSASKKIDLTTLAPRIHKLEEATSINRETWLLRLNSGAGDEFKASMKTVVPFINEETEASGVDTSSWLLRLNDGSNEFKSTMDNFMAQFTEKFNHDKAQMYNSDGVAVGRLVLERINNIVVGYFELNNTTNTLQLYYDTNASDPVYLPSSMRPSFDMSFHHGTENVTNTLQIKSSDGSLIADIDSVGTGKELTIIQINYLTV